METTAEAMDHLEQAYAYDDAQEYAKALAECDLAIEIDPDLADAHNLRGVVLEELGRSLEAISAYEEALRLDPEFTEAAENLANLRADFAASSNLVTIATFSHPTAAYIAKTRLDAAGIWSFVADAEMVRMNWLYSTALGGVKLKVREQDAEKAQEILNRKAEPTPSEEKVQEARCPQCGSYNIRYENYALRPIYLSWLLLQFPLPFLRRRWKCQDCGHAWKMRAAPSAGESSPTLE